MQHVLLFLWCCASLVGQIMPLNLILTRGATICVNPEMLVVYPHFDDYTSKNTIVYIQPPILYNNHNRI